MYYVYVIREARGRYYLGSTSDLRKRIESHNGSKNFSTRGRQWQLVYYEAYISIEAARERERHLKKDGRTRRYMMQRIKKSIESHLGAGEALE